MKVLKSKKYEGEPRLVASEFVALGQDNKIFVCSANDLFAEAIPENIILRILEHCKRYPQNTYLFQTKNPQRFIDLIEKHGPEVFPPKRIFCTTIETDDEELYKKMKISKAPSLSARVSAIEKLSNGWVHRRGEICYITVEPIMRFTDPWEFAKFIGFAEPDKVSIGADSKNNGLLEPDKDDIVDFVRLLYDFEQKIHLKRNLIRLIGKEEFFKLKRWVGDDA